MRRGPAPSDLCIYITASPSPDPVLRIRGRPVPPVCLRARARQKEGENYIYIYYYYYLFYYYIYCSVGRWLVGGWSHVWYSVHFVIVISVPPGPPSLVICRSCSKSSRIVRRLLAVIGSSHVAALNFDRVVTNCPGCNVNRRPLKSTSFSLCAAFNNK